MSDKRQVIYAGKIIRLTLDTVQLPNGSSAELEIVHHPGGAAVVAVVEHVAMAGDRGAALKILDALEVDLHESRELFG